MMYYWTNCIQYDKLQRPLPSRYHMHRHGCIIAIMMWHIQYNNKTINHAQWCCRSRLVNVKENNKLPPFAYWRDHLHIGEAIYILERPFAYWKGHLHIGGGGAFECWRGHLHIGEAICNTSQSTGCNIGGFGINTTQSFHQTFYYYLLCDKCSTNHIFLMKDWEAGTSSASFRYSINANALRL